MRRLALSTATALLLALPAMAGDALVHVMDAWARPSVPNRPAAVYMYLHNHGPETDRLVGVQSPVAAIAEIHTTEMTDGVMQMRKLEAVEIEPDDIAVLETGGLHVMLFDLSEPLKEGDVVPLTLVFEKAGEVTVDVAVARKGAGSGANGGHDHSGHDHSGHDHSGHDHGSHSHGEAHGEGDASE